MPHRVTPQPARPAAHYRLLAAALDGGQVWWAGTSGAPDAAPHLPGPGAARVAGGTAVVIATSGSTGAPRYAQFTAAAVLASARAALAVLSGPGQWVLALPTSHAAGVQVLARSWLAGLEPVVVDAPGAPHHWPAAFARAVASLELAVPHYTSLVPTQLRTLLRGPTPGRDALASLDAVLVGGAGLAPDLARQAGELGVRVVTTYGATETCGGCVYDAVALPGYEVAVDAHAGGAIRLRGPSLMSGYLGDARATSEVLRDGWFLTPDVGRLRGGLLEVVGRRDDVINTGGLKVAPGPVADAVTEVAPVREAVVLPHPDAHWGQAVVAIVEVEQGRGAGPATQPPLDHAWFAKVRDGVGTTVGRHAAPQAVVVVDRLPRLALGKPDRQALLALLGTLPTPVRGLIDLRAGAARADR